MQTIETERELLGSLRGILACDRHQQSASGPAAKLCQSLISVPPGPVTLSVQSFGFKHGLPVDADYVFDVRIPNPYYELSLRELTGMDTSARFKIPLAFRYMCRGSYRQLKAERHM